MLHIIPGHFPLLQTLSSAASPGHPVPIHDLILMALPDPQVTKQVQADQLDHSKNKKIYMYVDLL